MIACWRSRAARPLKPVETSPDSEPPTYVIGPRMSFQAAIPPSTWHAHEIPAACASCTAIAERSPYAQ